MKDSEVLRINAPTVIHESIDGEVVIVHLDTGGYFGLNATASEVWGMIDGTRPVAGVLDVMCARYGSGNGEMDDDVRRFLVSLGDHDLVASGSAEGGGESPAPRVTEPGPSAGYAPPELLAYTDMQDLLLLDPIHEVDERGWPNPKGEPPDGR